MNGVHPTSSSLSDFVQPSSSSSRLSPAPTPQDGRSPFAARGVCSTSTTANVTPLRLHSISTDYVLPPSIVTSPSILVHHNLLNGSNNNNANMVNNNTNNTFAYTLPDAASSLPATYRSPADRLLYSTSLNRSSSEDSHSSNSSNDRLDQLNADLPYPQFVRYSFGWLHQEHPLRAVCLKMISNPYPFHTTLL
jgi:hypothetical protein